MGEDCACERTDGTEPRGSRLPRISSRTLSKNPPLLLRFAAVCACNSSIRALARLSASS